MARSLAKALVAVAAIAIVMELASATNYTVGAPGGSWNLTTNLASWASAINFKTGDNLIFSYSPSFHNVLEVSKANYGTCTTAGPIKTYSSGDDVIPLSSAGNRYFICGFSGHCQAGMHIQVVTTAASSSGSPPPSTSPAASGSPPPPSSVASAPATPSTPEGSPSPTSTTPAGSTPSSSPARGLNLAEKAAAAGLAGVGMLMALSL